MPSVDRRWLPPALIAIAAVVSATMYRQLPAMIDLPFHALLPFPMTEPTDRAPRWLALSMMPALALVVWAAFRLAPTAAGQRIGRRMFNRAPDAVTSPEEFDRWGKTYDAIVLGVVMLLLGFHAAVLAMAWEAPDVAARIIPAVLGGSLVLMGNVIPRLRPNWVAGIRTRRVLENPQLWRSTHRAFGTAFVVSGVVTILAAVVAPQYGLLVGIASLAVSCVVGFVASTRQGNTATHTALLGLGLLCTSASGIPAQAPPDAASSREVLAPATVAESPFTFVHNGFTLDGTLAMPRSAAGRVPVVLIVAGSGPTDRNANGPLLNTNAYAMLAWGLAEHGIASVRYDKRGIGRSASVTGDPTTLTTDVYVADVAAAAQALDSDSRFSRVILLGHSEGAGHVLQAANRGAPAAGVVMVAPQGRPLADVIHEQVSRQADSATVASVDSAFARFLRGDDTGEVPAIARPLIVPAYRNLLRSLAAYDPPAEARRFAGPLLILYGTTDLQTTARDAEVLHIAQPRATLHRLEGVNHVLKFIESMDPQDQMKMYQDPSAPLAPSVVPAIVGWLTAAMASTGRGDRY